MMSKKRILVNSIDRIDIIKHEDLMYIHSSGKYSTFVTSDNRKITSSSNIGSHSLLLPKELFIRIHNSYVVNVNFIQFIQKGENWNVVLTNGAKIPVSRRKKEELLVKI